MRGIDQANPPLRITELPKWVSSIAKYHHVNGKTRMSARRPTAPPVVSMLRKAISRTTETRVGDEDENPPWRLRRARYAVLGPGTRCQPHPRAVQPLGAARGRALSERPLVDRADVARHGAGNTTRPTGKGIQWHGQGHRTHKWAGILAVAFAAAHWLVEMSGDLIKALVGRSGRLPKEHLGGFLDILRDLAKDLGEWAIYAAIAMLAITLWKRFPFNVWRTSTGSCRSSI